jgi:hypothetical protein
VSKHCPVTGDLLTRCECGACDDLNEGFGGDEGSDENEGPS